MGTPSFPGLVFTHDFANTIDKFGGKTKTADTSVLTAMLDYFAPPDKWSLSDMDFKYVVYDKKKKRCFMQDSFALKLDTAQQPDTSTMANCPFCMLPSYNCFTSLLAALIPY
jgi:hypothetical protein